MATTRGPRGSSAAIFCSGRDDLPDRPGWGTRGSGGPVGGPRTLPRGFRGPVWTGFGRMFAGVKIQKWSGNCFISVQKRPKSTGLENKTWRIRFSGSRGPGGAQKGPKWLIWGSRKIAFLAPFWRPHNYEYWETLGSPSAAAPPGNGARLRPPGVSPPPDS